MDRYNVKIDFDLQSTPLQIVTDSVLGSGERIRVEFHPQTEGLAHEVGILFTDPPQYYISRCGLGWVTFSLPDTQVLRTWTITKTNNEALSIACDGVEIVSYLFSSSSDAQCVTRWTTYVVDLKFKADGSGTDTASDEYRAKPTGK